MILTDTQPCAVATELAVWVLLEPENGVCSRPVSVGGGGEPRPV